jgi:hypothetical protein
MLLLLVAVVVVAVTILVKAVVAQVPCFKVGFQHLHQ